MLTSTLAALNINGIQAGTWSGTDQCLSTNQTDKLVSINPTNGSCIGEVYESSLADYQIVVEKATTTLSSWQQTPAPKRGEIVRQIGEQLRQHKKALSRLVSFETGKILQEGEGEVQEMIDMADFAVGQSRMLYGKSMHSERPAHRLYEQWHPLGVTGVITAFNFPVAVWAWNAFIAAIAGNTVIWKPASKAPLCAIAVQKLCNKVMQHNGLNGIFSLLVSANNTLPQALVTDKRIPLIAFTGSTSIGKQVSCQVAERFGRSILELSGNNGLIIDKTADLKLALQATLFGAIGTAGQRCTTTRRVFVHKAISDTFIKSLTAAYQKILIGDPLSDHIMMGPLIDLTAVETYQGTIKAIRKLGGHILSGGKVLNDRPGFFVEPTIVLAKPSWKLLLEEHFVPILYVLTYDRLDEAIGWHNQATHGLSSAIFTQDLLCAERFLSSQGSDCGIANVNVGTSGAEIGGAFGGEKETGGGREAGSDAWKGYMRRQTVTINWGKTLPLAQSIQWELDKQR